MAVNTRAGVAARNAGLDAALATIGTSGFLRIYDGAQPTDADTALGAQVLLASLPLSATAFGAASGGVATAAAITNATAGNTGTASWASFLTSAGVRKIDCSVGTASANVIINATAIASGATVSCSSATITWPLQGA